MWLKPPQLITSTINYCEMLRLLHTCRPMTGLDVMKRKTKQPKKFTLANSFHQLIGSHFGLLKIKTGAKKWYSYCIRYKIYIIKSRNYQIIGFKQVYGCNILSGKKVVFKFKNIESLCKTKDKKSARKKELSDLPIDISLDSGWKKQCSWDWNPLSNKSETCLHKRDIG